MCSLDLKLPKSTPAAYIVSEFFGERILVDCKTVYKKGYIVVAVDHFTTFTWTTFVETKVAKPIAEFVGSVMESVDTIRNERPGTKETSDQPRAMKPGTEETRDQPSAMKPGTGETSDEPRAKKPGTGETSKTPSAMELYASKSKVCSDLMAHTALRIP